LKCSFCFGLGHTKDRCWKKFAKGPIATTNFLEILVNDEETTLLELNYICGEEEHVFFGIKMPKRRLHVSTSMAEV
jgi:hypothetical protein